METRSGKRLRLFVCLVAAAVAINTVFAASAFEVAAAPTSVKIGQACCDERGKVKGGKAGDQTGNEAAVASWTYSSSSSAFNHWNYVFRCKNPKTAKKLAKKMIEACENDHIGYDQQIPDRYSFHEEAEKVGWDIKAITTNCETTCTSAMAVCLNAVGIPTRKIWTVDHVYNDLYNTQQFYILTSKKYTASSTYLEPGDILLSPCHGAMVVESPNAPGSIPIDASPTAVDTTPKYTVGNDYQLTTHLYVREGPGKEYTIKFRDDLTSDAKKYAEDGSFAILNSGTVVTCLDCSSGWIKIPSGWICGQLDGRSFVEDYTGSDEQKAAYEAAKNPTAVQGGGTEKAAETTKTTTATTQSGPSFPSGNTTATNVTSATEAKASSETTTAAKKTTSTTKAKSSSSSSSKKTSKKTTTTKKTTTKKTTTKKTTTKKTSTKKTSTKKKTTTKKSTTTKKKTTKKKSTKLVIKAGKDYKLKKALYVRKGPGKKYKIKKRSQLTEDGKKHSKKSSKAILKKGTVVTCLEVKGNWMRIPSGWICAKKGNIKKAS